MMRVSYDWLSTYVGRLPPPRELAERFTMTGSNVEAVEEVGADTCFEVEITTNRSDCLCHLGLAREAAAVARSTLRMPEITFDEGDTPVERLADVEVLASDLCPRYTARVIEDVTVGPSPAWLRRRIEAVGLRPVNNVVDVTNFVLFECGQPLHAFDLDKLDGARIAVRRAKADEEMTAIDGSRHVLNGDMLVISDASRPVAVAGVMGGQDTEVGPGTTRVLLESAEFDPVSVRRTSRALGLASDSSYRFERGIDPLGVGWGSRRAAQLIQQVTGGRIAQGVIDVNLQQHEEPVVTLRLSRIGRLLGVGVERDEVIDILDRLQFGLEGIRGEVLRVHVPSFRPDVTREVDLIEEVARIHGYDRVPTRPTMRIQLGRPAPRDLVVRAIRTYLTGTGLFEAVTFSLLSEDETGRFSPWTDAVPAAVADARRGRENCLRTALLPSLLKVRRTNRDRAHVDAEVFEIASVYLPRPGEALPDEPLHLGLVLSGDFRRAKGLVEGVLSALGVRAAATWEPFETALFEAGSSARLVFDGATVGYVGGISGEVRETMGLRREAAAAELDLEVLIPHAVLRPQLEPLAAYPAIDRDLNVVVDGTTPWADIERVVGAAGGELLREVVFRETYTGRPVPAGRKSVVFGMVFRADDHTLTGEEADAAQSAVLAALAEHLGAELRR